jgi:hypothetical protein
MSLLDGAGDWTFCTTGCGAAVSSAAFRDATARVRLGRGMVWLSISGAGQDNDIRESRNVNVHEVSPVRPEYGNASLSGVGRAVAVRWCGDGKSVKGRKT